MTKVTADDISRQPTAADAESEAIFAWPQEPDNQLLSALTDTHCHPTDYKRFKDEKAEYRGATQHIPLGRVSMRISRKDTYRG